MRVAIPEIENKKTLFSYLRDNQKEIITQKKKLPIKSDDFEYGCLEIIANDKDKIGKSVLKMTGEDSSLSEGEVKVKPIANMHGWCDSYMDVLIPGSADKTINDKAASNEQLLYHLKNHNYSTDGIVGGQVKAYTQQMSLDKFNLESDLKKSEALIVESIVRKRYDSKVYHLYLDDEIKQHSIGLRYIKIYLCMDSEDEEDTMYKENWDKYYKYVINKAKVDSKCYFWAVVEYKLLENSSVLFGANELTPTQEISKNIEPLNDTQKSEAANALRKNQVEFYKNLNR